MNLLQDCLKELTQRSRDIIQHRFTEQLSTKAVAQLLELSISSVDVIAFRAKKTLAECVKRRMA